ncbi:type II toxin-antitoxin system death-on-curing family toxin, partial [Listeria cossartiae]
IEASKKAREASNFEEHLKREKAALEEINKGGKNRSRNLIDNTDEIAKDIRNINKKYSNGFEQNNSIDSIINSASYYNDTWEQTSAVTRSIADHAFENGNKRTAFDTLNMLLDEFNLKSPLNDTQKWDLIEKLGRKEITDVSKIANILKGK